MKWEGATAVITGASRGIGRAVAHAAAERGARVGLIARSKDDLEDVLRSIGGSGAVAAADVADRAQIEEALARIEQQLGPIDILVANAGIGMYGAFAEADVNAIERLVQVNLMGTVYPVRAVLPGMTERHRGHVVVVSSVAGRFGSPFEAPYSATKWAQIGLAEAMSVEVAGQGVGVSVVNPGVVATDFFEARGHAYERSFPKPISAERVARAVIRAVERERPETFVPGWFRGTVVIRDLLPRFYRWGTRKSFKL